MPDPTIDPDLDDVDDLTRLVRDLPVLRPAETGHGKHLRALRSYYDGTHHDHLPNTWEGAAREPGLSYLQERLVPSGFVPVNGVPYGRRRPNAGGCLVRQVVNRFTEMLLGDGRQPEVQTPADARTQDWLAGFFEAANLWDVLQEARDVAGSSSASAVVLCARGGVPWSEVLAPQDLYVAAWADGPGWVPEVVVEQRLVERQVLREGELKSERVWCTRAWTPTHEVTYKDAPEKHPPGEPIGVEEETPHEAGRCPVVWYQNTRNTASPYGQPDCEGTFHLVDRHDRLRSFTVRAAQNNVDPTLLVKEHQRNLRRGASDIVKGSVIQLSADSGADAKYLEMAGSGIETALKVLKDLRDEVLETAECVIPDPGMAGAYRSVDAMMMVWRSMEAKAGRLRVPLGGVIAQLCALAVAYGTNGAVVLPPRVVSPDGDVDDAPAELEDREVGEGLKAWESIALLGGGGLLRLDWPPYWPPTPEQIGQLAVALKGAVGDKPVMSRQSGVEVMAKYMGLDPKQELERIEEDEEEAAKKMEDMLKANTPPEGAPGEGPPGEDGEEGEGPPKPGQPKPPKPEAGGEG